MSLKNVRRCRIVPSDATKLKPPSSSPRRGSPAGASAGTSDGLAIEPNITVPPDATNIVIGSDGTVTAEVAGQTQASQLGKLQLATFPNPGGLNALGHNIYAATPSSGEATVGDPGSEGRGRFMQGALEGSNVEVVTEMIDLVRTQRAYEVNSKVISAADEMLRSATQVR